MPWKELSLMSLRKELISLVMGEGEGGGEKNIGNLLVGLNTIIPISAFAAAPPGQELDKPLDIVENSLIEFFMAQGHELFTKAGLKFPRHTITFEGNRKGSSLVPKGMNTRNRAVVSRSKYL